jgi:hypothetical protein
MTAANWGFKPMGRADMNADPVHDEFFSTEAIDSLAAALVRESGQNSLDARADGHVQVRFVFGTESWTLPATAAHTYLESLKAHVQAPDSGIRADELPAFDGPVPFLAIEDFGTRGLQGDPMQANAEENDGEGSADFYYFWRNLGRSGKKESDRGRWGLGHTVFAAASRVHSFFGLTKRCNDGRRLLMGQSIVKIHRIGKEKFFPYGWYGIVEPDYFVTPIEDQAAIEKFEHEFHLERQKGSGLSVVIPFPDPSITSKEVTKAFIRHYFAPLIRGTLSVLIETAGATVKLSRETLRSCTADHFNEPELQNLLKTFDLVEWSQTVPDGEIFRHDPLPSGRAPVWDLVKFTDETHLAMTKRYEDKQRLAVRISLSVKEKGKPLQSGSFTVYLERDPQLDKGEIHFVRQDITVANQKVGAERGVRALIVIDDKALAQLLGDAENPAHTEWQDRSEKFKNKYDHGTSTLRFVKNSAAHLIRILTAASQEKDRDLLKDLFFVVQPSEDGSERGGSGEWSGKHKSKGPMVPPPPPKSPPPVRLEKIAGGFRISMNPAVTPMPRQVTVRMGYAVRTGDPVKRYEPEDFRIESDDFKLEHAAAEVVSRAENQLVVNLQGADSNVRLTGFDQHRDLQIRLKQTEIEQA